MLVLYKLVVMEQFRIQKFYLKKHWNLLVFILETKLHYNKKQANFRPISIVFSKKYSNNPHLHTTFIVFKFYTAENSIPPFLKYTIKIKTCFEVLIITKLFQNPYIILIHISLILWSNLNYKKMVLVNLISFLFPIIKWMYTIKQFWIKISMINLFFIDFIYK